MKTCWSVFRRSFVALLLALVASIAIYYFYADAQVRARVESTLSKAFPDFSVYVGSARLIQGEGIRVRQVSLMRPSTNDSTTRTELVFIDELNLRCATSPAELLKGDLAIKHIYLRNLTLRPTRHEDGSWNLEKLLPLPQLGNNSQPDVMIDGATIEVIDHLNRPTSVLTLTNVNARLTPRNAAQSESGTAAIVDYEVDVVSDHFRRATVSGTFDKSGLAWSLKGNVVDLRQIPELTRSLPHPLSKQLEFLRDFQARADIAFVARYEAGKAEPLTFAAKGRVSQGRLQLAQLAFPFSEISAIVEADNRGWSASNVVAQYGEAKLKGNFRQQGFDVTRPMSLAVEANNLTFTSELADLLPPDLHRGWERFQPTGRIHGNLQLSYNGSQWQTNATVDCLDVSILCRDFPYPLEHTRGTVTLSNDLLSIDELVGFANETPVRLQAEIKRPGRYWTGHATVVSDGTIRLDERAVAAMKPTSRELVRSLRAGGAFRVYHRLERAEPDDRLLKRHLVLDVIDGSVRYEHFPYPLHQIHGKIEMVDGKWFFPKLEGHNGSSYVVCSGKYVPQHKESPLALDFKATDVAFDDDLLAALSPGAHELWKQMRPQGTVDHVDIQLRQPPNQPLDIHVVGNKLQIDPSADEPSENRRLTVNPRWFPYRMENVSGTAAYHNGTITLTELRAHHDNVRFRSDGEGSVAADGSWSVLLNKLEIDEIRPDRDLVEALPEGLAAAIESTEMSGLFALEGALGISGDDANIRMHWNVALDVHGGHINCGIPLDHMYGQVRLWGRSVDEDFATRGSLLIESLHHDHLQFSDVRGPIYVDNKRVVLGQPKNWNANQTSDEQVNGNVFGGLAAMAGEIRLTGEGNFSIAARLRDGDLREVARDFDFAENNLAGRTMATIQLQGNSLGRHSFEGSGRIGLRDANIYELPHMIALLKWLSVRPADQTAFTSSDVSFRVQGEHIYFDQFDLHGDAITLKGQGQLASSRDLDLNFYTIIGRENRLLPEFRKLWGQASRQVLEIRVTGNLLNEQPLNMTRSVLPRLNESLHQLFPELDPTQTPPRSARGSYGRNVR